MNIGRFEARFFLQFTKHRLLSRLTLINAPLWELPTGVAWALAPKNLTGLINQHHSDIQTKTVAV